MIDPFVVFHKKEPGSQDLVLGSSYFHLATCLRSVVFSWSDRIGVECPGSLLDYEMYRGEQAYAFVLKIICGLESPMVGETEIFGQFKQFLKQKNRPFPSHLNEVFESLIRDTKKIRADFLQNMGCTSYGSLLRKHLRGTKQDLVVLGAGSLAQDIFPWFSKQTSQVRAYTRSPEKYRELEDKQKNLSICSLNPTPVTEPSTLVVAAPFSAQDIQRLFDLPSFVSVYDLRADSHVDRLSAGSVKNLQELFRDLEVHKKQAASIKENALHAVQKRAQLFNLMEKPRPFGWEDLYMYA